jgi:CheY-like chemotaxis protein
MAGAPFIPAAALTSFARDEDRQQALQAGFQLHLVKPIDSRALVEAVASLTRIELH